MNSKRRSLFGWLGVAFLAFVLLVTALWALGYTRLPARPEVPVQAALPSAMDSNLDQRIAPLQAAHPGESGFHLVNEGVEAFALRALATRHAGRSLDVQTYIWNDDETGRLLVDEVLAAADRGVRVRLLLDDLDARAKNFSLAGLDAHPNIKVRLFNPFASRRGTVGKIAEFASSFRRMNHRMHNKQWIADNRIAIAGGRNVGDEYFAASSAVNFQDLDYAVLGPAVERMSESFDRYWNSSAAWPVAALNPGLGSAASLQALRDTAAENTRRTIESPWARALAGSDAIQQLVAGVLPLHWTSQWLLLADDPLKAQLAGDGLARSEVLRGLVGAINQAGSSVTLISPYFVPGSKGTSLLTDLAAAGKRVSILTNSLAANDVAAVHGGYAKSRKALINGGVSLWELKPTPGEAPRFSLFGSSGASLHTKAALVDDATAFVGSFNLDPRSVSLNTEQGLLVTDPALGAELGSLFMHSTAGSRAWRVEADAGGRLRWSDGQQLATREPEASLGRRLVAGALRWLPFDSQL